jgi:hypothetical protein
LDGTGHYAVAHLYSQSTFPDTFGWTHAYFGGMPFPNFYPPLYYWAVSALARTGLLSFEHAVLRQRVDKGHQRPRAPALFSPGRSVADLQVDLQVVGRKAQVSC